MRIIRAALVAAIVATSGIAHADIPTPRANPLREVPECKLIDFDVIEGLLIREFRMMKTAHGVTKGRLMLFWIGPGGRWAVTTTYPGGATCIVLGGDGFEVLGPAQSGSPA